MSERSELRTAVEAMSSDLCNLCMNIQSTCLTRHIFESVIQPIQEIRPMTCGLSENRMNRRSHPFVVLLICIPSPMVVSFM